jgi:YD repeat-containing protein
LGKLGFITEINISGGQALQYIKVELLLDNNPPVFTTLFPTTSPQANKTFQYQAKAVDPNNDTVVFSLVTAPNGASISASGLLTWNPNASQIGENSFTIRASDGKGRETLQTGNLMAIEDASNHVTTYQYDALNRRINKVLPMGQQTRATYDAVGNYDGYRISCVTDILFLYRSFSIVVCGQVQFSALCLNKHISHLYSNCFVSLVMRG